jgi:hypothetical protein
MISVEMSVGGHVGQIVPILHLKALIGVYWCFVQDTGILWFYVRNTILAGVPMGV